MKKIPLFLALPLLLLLFPLVSLAAAGNGEITVVFLMIAVILVAAKVSAMVEKFGQPSVLGELVMGVVLGNLVLLGITIFEPIKENGIIKFLAELGVVILLFQVGLESNIQKMKKVGVRAFAVAVIGVVLPFVLGTYFAGPLLLPGQPTIAYLFLGAALTATSVGITARVFKDLGKLQLPAAQVVLGAAVIDDVLGLIILAVISAIATVGAVSLGVISWIIAKAILFLIGSIVVGQISAPYIGRMFSKIHNGVSMKFSLAFGFCLFFAYAANQIGLAPIIGAFAAGLVLDPVHFKSFKDPLIVDDMKKAIENAPESELKNKISENIHTHAHRHVEELMEPIAHFLVPIFFIMVGMGVRLETLFDTKILLVALAITVIAFVGKIMAGLAAEKGSRMLVGWGMVPRGEVGLIFASIGLSLGVISDSIFSVIVIMVILTTLVVPSILTKLLKKQNSAV
ncbi:MAG: cation:proton antiporter [Candidatus Paceibacterota bacterium]|nr:MAG: cation:proton antiporter [Candidatus Paceibacterota bacterium]